MINLLALAAIFLVLYRVIIDLFPVTEKDVFKDSEVLIGFEDVEELTLNLWDKLIDQATAEAEHDADVKCWISTFREMREGDIQLYSFLRNRLSKKEMRHLVGTLNYSGVYSLANDVFREKETHLDVEGLKNLTFAVSTCIDNFGAAKRKVLARAKSFCDTKVAVLENFRLANSGKADSRAPGAPT